MGVVIIGPPTEYGHPCCDKAHRIRSVDSVILQSGTNWAGPDQIQIYYSPECPSTPLERNKLVFEPCFVMENFIFTIIFNHTKFCQQKKTLVCLNKFPQFNQTLLKLHYCFIKSFQLIQQQNYSLQKIMSPLTFIKQIT